VPAGFTVSARYRQGRNIIKLDNDVSVVVRGQVLKSDFSRFFKTPKLLDATPYMLVKQRKDNGK